MPMNLRYPSVIRLSGTDLTEESRGPLQEDRDERSVVVDLASGKKRKFIKGIRRKWSVEWENVAGQATHTLDGKAGRNEIRSLAQSGSPLTLVIRDGRNADETYTVYVESYNESLTMRRSGFFRYRITLSLEEQG